MSLKQTVLLVLVSVLVALGVAVVVHPEGKTGVLRMLGLEGVSRGAEPPPGTPDRVLDRVTRAANEIANGDEAYDSGDFGAAVTFYTIASTAAQDDAQARKADNGRQRAVLAWALVVDPPAADYAGRTPRDRMTELLGRARAENTEQAWLDAALFAAAADQRTELASAVRAALDLAAGGGPVEMRLRAAVPVAREKERALREAMTARGFGAGLPPPATGPGATGLVPPGHVDEPSGIGGVGTAPRLRVPFGNFTAEMRERLRAAVAAEQDGLEQYRLAGPEGTDRESHRREAHRLLKEARDTYNAALEMDPDARDVERRLHEVMVALGQLNKERTTADE